MDQHSLICAVKQLAMELGQTPTRAQFETHVKAGKYNLEKQFGTYSALLVAAGLVPYRERRIDQSVFNKDLERHLDAYVPNKPLIKTPYPSIAVISDIHWPFHNQRVLDMFLEYVADVKPEYVILNGDAWDMYSHSKFPRSHNVFIPREEERLAKENNEKFWRHVRTLSPSSKLYQMMGNHDVRPMKRVLESYPEAEDWIKEKLENLFRFESVTTVMDPREEVVIGDIAVFHGYMSQLGAHRDYTLMNTINGHTHKGGTVFRRIRGQTLWELNSGFAGDPEAKGLTYTMQKINVWSPGFGGVDKNGPRFIPV